MKDCRAKRWRGEPCHDGPHGPHSFVYGYNGLYFGTCVGVKPDPYTTGGGARDDGEDVPGAAAS